VPGYENYLAHGIWHHNSTKTYFLAAAAVTLATGRAVVGMPVGDPLRALILDWETDRYAHAERMRALCRGAGVACDPKALGERIYYRSMVSSMAESAAYVRREIDRLGVGAVFLDSLGMACGGELESAESILRCFIAIRTLGVPALIASHVTKAAVANQEGGPRRLSPFGSIFTENAARNTWSLEWSGEEGASVGHVALIHQKTNNGRYEKRHAYSVQFSSRPGTARPEGVQAADTDADDLLADERIEAVAYRRADIAAIEAFRKHVSLADQLLDILTGGAMAAKEAADAIDAPQDQVRARLRDLMQRGKVVQLPDRRYAKAYLGTPPGGMSTRRQEQGGVA